MVCTETEDTELRVRVTNLSFLQTEWYVDQLLRQAYESDPLPIKWSRPAYSGEAGTAAFVITRQEIENALRQNNIPLVSFGNYFDINAFTDTLSLRETMENLRNNKNSKITNPFNTGNTQIIPGNLLKLNVDTAAIDWESMHSKPRSSMLINLEGKSVAYRQELMILEILANINDDNWKRSIHFATTIPPNLFMNLQDTNFSLNGLTYQVVPGKPLSGGVNTAATYDNMMNKFRYGGLEENPNIYLDETNRRMISTFRLYFSELINALIEEGENEKALAALNKATTVMPSSAVHYGTDGLLYARAYFNLGETEKAEALIEEIGGRINSNLDWFIRLTPLQISNSLSDIIYYNINPLLLITSIYQENDRDKYNMMVDNILHRAESFYTRGGNYVGDIILREITDNSIRGFYTIPENDTVARASEEEIMKKTLSIMQQYSPKLLEHYSGGQSN